MMKILIVDDEKVEREGLQAIIRRGFPDLLIDQARNGTQAVEVADLFLPDLVLMDVKMAGMNGLEAVERIQEKHPDTQFIMVTAFDTFDYARTALKLGVKDYLLKPSKAADIISTVGNVLRQIELSRQQSAGIKRQQDLLHKVLPLIETDVVTQLLFDHVHDVHIDELVGLLGTAPEQEMFVALVLIPSGAEHRYPALKEKIRQSENGWIGPLTGRQLPVIVFRRKEHSYRSQAAVFARELLTVARAEDGPGWFIGIGNPCASLELVRQSYQESLLATTDPLLPVKYRFFADSAGSPQKQANGRVVKTLMKSLIDWVRLGQWGNVRSAMLETARQLEEEHADLYHIQQKMLEMLWLSTRVMNESGIETDMPFYSYQTRSIQELSDETALILERMKQIHADYYSRLTPDPIQQLKRYVFDNACKDISLEMVSREVGLSPIYVSKLFKEQLNINYIDYLTQCRMDRAKQLMADPDKSMKEIAIECGYHDPNYFSKVFRKSCGVPPTEFRESLFGKKQGVADE